MYHAFKFISHCDNIPIILMTAHDAAGRAASFPRRPNNIQVLQPQCQLILHTPVLRAIRCDSTLCAHISASTPISFCRHTRGLGFSTLSLTPEERTWLQTTCPYLKPSYLDSLAAYRFKPSQVHVSFVPRAPDSNEGRIEIEMSGPWAEVIFWEVPLLATLSEIYFTTVDKDWDHEGQAGASNLRGCLMCTVID